MLQKVLRFLQERYGIDDLSKFMMGIVFILAVINMFFRLPVLSAFICAVIILIYFRMFSKNKYKRYQENQLYLKYMGPFQNWIRKQINIIKLRKDYHIYTCPTCKQKIKIPRGKGRIAVRCPKCRTEFIKKS